MQVRIEKGRPEGPASAGTACHRLVGIVSLRLGLRTARCVRKASKACGTVFALRLASVGKVSSREPARVVHISCRPLVARTHISGHTIFDALARRRPACSSRRTRRRSTSRNFFRATSCIRTAQRFPSGADNHLLAIQKFPQTGPSRDVL